MRLTTEPHIVPRLGMSGTVPPLPPVCLYGLCGDVLNHYSTLKYLNIRAHYTGCYVGTVLLINIFSEKTVFLLWVLLVIMWLLTKLGSFSVSARIVCSALRVGQSARCFNAATRICWFFFNSIGKTLFSLREFYVFMILIISVISLFF
jgi:hypothetical protein